MKRLVINARKDQQRFHSRAADTVAASSAAATQSRIALSMTEVCARARAYRERAAAGSGSARYSVSSRPIF